MRYLGTLVEWNDQRGFGFVQADEGGERVFVHISDFQPRPSALARPQCGWRVDFAVVGQSGKKRAQNVVWRNVERAAAAKAPSKGGRSHVHADSSYLAILAFVLIFLGVAAVWGMQAWVASLYAVLSLITFFAYWKDKAAALAGRWRTPESTLHALTVLGGWPGAILAQQWLRHKSSKAQFQLIFWLTVVLNVAALVWLHSPWGREWLALLHAQGR